MRVGVIGAGASGLAVGRRMIEDMPGVDFIIFEQGVCVGGTWIYTEEQFEDEYHLPIHSSMYKSLRTNLPKETMQFFGFPYDEIHEGFSYLHAADIEKYLKQYAEHFQLTKNIKFRHCVTSVQLLPDDKWRIMVTDLTNDQEKQFDFDAVFICNGHNHCPNLIKIEGQDVFAGFQLHSHHYRKPDSFKDKSILVIGSGPSGTDISCELSSVAKCVYLSHHDPSIEQLNFPDNVIKKPDVQRLSENSVQFVDGSTSFIDAILYCTGYKINMPFLTPQCGLQVTDFSVEPLFLHMVNINHPTMFFIGLLNKSFLFPLYEMQAQFCINAFNETVALPTKEDMLKFWEAENEDVKLNRRKPHYLGNKAQEYHNLVQELGKTNMYDPVVMNIYNDSALQKKADFLKYRNDVYIVVDKEKFHRTKVNNSE